MPGFARHLFDRDSLIMCHTIVNVIRESQQLSFGEGARIIFVGFKRKDLLSASGIFRRCPIAIAFLLQINRNGHGEFTKWPVNFDVVCGAAISV